MTDNEATRTTFVRTRPALHEDEAKVGRYEADTEAKNVGLEYEVSMPTRNSNWVDRS